MTPDELLARGIAMIKEQIDLRIAADRMSYLHGLNDALMMCCSADQSQILGNHRLLVDFSEFIRIEQSKM